MARILTLELSHDRHGADRLADVLTARSEDVLAGREPEALAPSAEPEEDSFDFSEPSAPPAAAGDEAPFAILDDEPAATVVPTAPATDEDPFLAAVREAFVQEAGDLLAEMDHQALELERGGQVGAIVRELFRAYHTLKGSANTVGLAAIGAAAHAAEDQLEDWAPGTIDPRAAATALLRLQRDLRAAISDGAVPPTPEQVTGDLQRARLASDSTAAPAPTTAPVVVEDSAPGERRSLRVAAEHLDRLMRLAGELVTTRSRLGARLTGLGAIQRDLTASRNRLVATVDGFRERHEFAGLDGAKVPRVTSSRAGNRVEALFTDLELDRYEDIHVLSRSLAEITGDIGELQAQIAASVNGIGEDSESLGTAVGGIQGEITRARMVTLEALFARLHLAAQDAAERAQRPVQVTLAGAAVALDRAIVDGIATPLLHLVRNAVAHGIEDPETRLLAGKSADGAIRIAARQEGGLIIVEVADDGGGLDLAKLHRRGRELGLIDETTPLDSEIVRQLVFVPGLSTTTQADSVSGRGLGCDVARQEIQRLNGTVTVSSVGGTGTTFTVTLPLTLAISRALEVVIGEARYAVPMNFIDRILDLETAQEPLDVLDDLVLHDQHRQRRALVDTADPEMPEDIGAKVLEGFIAMSDSDAGKEILKNAGYEIQGLKTSEDSFYDAFRAALQASGVDITTMVK
jgi:chemosensory pili system protein ChpA (sensor histidine kinase/response regulator)